MSVKFLAKSAIIAAIYAALTLLLAPISFGLVQIRVSEAMCVLVMFTPAAIPGLFVGCLSANILAGAHLLDIIFGSLATLLAAFIGYRLRSVKWLAPMPAVAVNALVIGALLHYVYVVGVSLPLCMAYVAAGQLAACYGLGMPLALVLNKPSLQKLLV